MNKERGRRCINGIWEWFLKMVKKKIGRWRLGEE